jgi:transcriptional regulator GlxA family with amidase domain
MAALLFISGCVLYIIGNQSRRLTNARSKRWNPDIDLLVLPETNLILLPRSSSRLRAANRIAGKMLYDWRFSARTARRSKPRAVSLSRWPGLSGRTTDGAAVRAVKLQLAGLCDDATEDAAVANRAHREVMAGIEAGTWFLAETSLLDNFSATNHWEDFEDFAAAYPQITMVRERFVIDGKRITTGGSLPTLDLMLELIRRSTAIRWRSKCRGCSSTSRSAPAATSLQALHRQHAHPRRRA